MESPIFLADNLFDDLLYTAHTITANEEATGYEAWHIANGRRSDSDYWAPTTENNDAWVEVACDRVRAANCIAIDRGHTLAGKTVALEISDDNFTTKESVFSVTFSSSYGHGSRLSAASGARTEEGAWVKSFPLRVAKYWRLYITAASSYVPRVVGLWVGLSYDGGELHGRPFDEDATTGAWSTAANQYGWSANSADVAPRTGQALLRIGGFHEYDAARLLLDLYRRGRPMWYVPNTAQAERAMLIQAPQGAVIQAPYRSGWGYRELPIPYKEYQPRID